MVVISEKACFFKKICNVINDTDSEVGLRLFCFEVLEYRKEGYLQDALINYLALLGWSTEDSQQLFFGNSLIENFSLDRCNSSPATFDPSKLLWMNGEYIRSKSDQEIYDLFIDWIEYTNQQDLIKDWEHTLEILANDEDMQKRWKVYTLPQFAKIPWTNVLWRTNLRIE